MRFPQPLISARVWSIVHRGFYHGLAVGVALTTASLVILDVVGASLHGLFQSPLPPFTATHRPDDPPGVVRNYVMFTQVPYGDVNVTTGIRYTSNENARIDHQWCYLNDATIGGHTARLDLATAGARGRPTPTDFTREALEAFDLTRRAARILIRTHCRFE